MIEGGKKRERSDEAMVGSAADQSTAPPSAPITTATKVTTIALDPSTLVTADHVVAGHDGPMSDDSGTLFIKPCTDSEISFYEVATAKHPALASLMPTYHGKLDLLGEVDPDGDGTPTETALASATASLAAKQQPIPKSPMQTQSKTEVPQPQLLNTVSANSNNAVTSPRKAHFGKPLDTPLCIVLEDVATHFQHPNILDLKLGAQLWDHNAHPEKRARLDKVASQTTSKSLSFRISGMRVWHGRGGDDCIEKPGVPDEESDENGDTDPRESSLANLRVSSDNTGTSDILAHPSSTLPLTPSSESTKAAAETTTTTTTTTVHEPESGYTFYNKIYGRTFSAETVQAGFRVFLCPELPTRTHSSLTNADSQANKRNAEPITKRTTPLPKSTTPLLRARSVTHRILADIRRMIHILEQEETRMFSSSILIVYEGDSDLLEKTLQPSSSSSPTMATQDGVDQDVNTNNLHDAKVVNDHAKDSAMKPSKSKSKPEPKLDSSSSPSNSKPRSSSGPSILDPDSDSDSDATVVPKSHAVRLIDFAHSSWAPGQGPDEHQLQGVRNVAAVLEGLVEEFDEEIRIAAENGG